MKRMLIIICLIFSASGIYAQNQKFYCDVFWGSSGKHLYAINFGDFIYNGSNEKVIVDDAGKQIKFGNLVQIANYLSGKGWELEQTYSTTSDIGFTNHWIFSKEAESLEHAVQNIKTADNPEHNKRR